MSRAARYLEVAAFVALAVTLHLLLFWRDPAQGEIAGGAGGAATVSMTGANDAMAEMVEAWETAPDAPAAIDEMDAPDQPQDVDVALAETTPHDAMQAPEAPVLETPTVEAPRPQTEAPEVRADPLPTPDAISPPAPEPLAGLALPSNETAPPPPDAPAAPVQPQRMVIAQIDDLAPPPPEPEPEVEPETTLAPEAAPTPRRKPEPPAKPVRRAEPKPEQTNPAQPEPARSAQAPEAPPSPTEADAPAPQGQTAAGSGGGAQEGSGTADISVGVLAEERANMMQVWGGKIRREVDRKKKRPRAIRRAGVARIALTVARDGGLIAARVQRSSGSDGLDAAALQAVKAAAPFDRAPDELENPQYSFVLPIRFER
ncbi:MAG: TonB family protein [Pseudomonadota bacterium]